MAWAEKKAGFAFHELQRTALQNALAHKLSILTGGPGTGKTTCLRALVDIIKAKKARIHLAAPTGRAAQRLAEAAGCPASTIHRLLKYEGGSVGFTVDDAHPLATDFLIVDEASMLDARLAAALLQAVLAPRPPAAGPATPTSFRASAPAMSLQGISIRAGNTPVTRPGGHLSPGRPEPHRDDGPCHQ